MLTLFSPAKLNLFLRILRKRDDGYHELASLFQTISLGDTLHFASSSIDELTAEGVSMPTDSSNLILRASSLFRKKTGLETHVKVHAIKKIPVEAGLGGGSSNAATTLWAMNEVAGRPASTKQLMEWGGEIGSDVAFFLSQGTAYCTGRGEVIQEMPALPFDPVLTLVKPPEGLSTPLVYKTLRANELPNRDPQVSLKCFYQLSPEFYNDLEIPAFELSPSLENLKNKLLLGGFDHVVLAGSGTTLFCIGNVKLSNANLLRENVRFIRRNNSEWY